MIRHLCQVTTTLEPVPEEFYIFAKMEYVDSCPDDYLPEGFRPAEDEGGAYFDAKPFVLYVSYFLFTCSICCGLEYALQTT